VNQTKIIVMERNRFGEVTLCQQSLSGGVVVYEAVFLHWGNMQPETDSIFLAPHKAGLRWFLLEVSACG